MSAAARTSVRPKRSPCDLNDLDSELLSGRGISKDDPLRYGVLVQKGFKHLPAIFVEGNTHKGGAIRAEFLLELD